MKGAVPGAAKLTWPQTLPSAEQALPKKETKVGCWSCLDHSHPGVGEVFGDVLV